MEKEIETLQELLQKDPSNFQARRELSVLLANNGFNEEALSNFLYLIKYFPEDAELHYNIGILYEKQKDFINAKKSYERAIEISPQEDFYYNLGEVLVSLEEWQKALEAFKTVLKTDPNDGNCFFNMGLCYYHLEQKNQAIDNFQKAINLNSKDIFAYFYLGNLYQEQGLTNFAEENYRKVLEISPDYSWAYYNLASIAFSNHNIELAKEYLHKTIELNYMDIDAYKLLTKIYLIDDNSEDIIVLLETRLEKEENGDLRYILAQVYKRIGDTQNYYKNLKYALENYLTLTYPKNIVNQELEYVKSLVSVDEELETEEYEEYSSDEDYDSDESEDFEDDEEEFVEEGYYDEEESSEGYAEEDSDIEYEDESFEDYEEEVEDEEV